MTVHELKTWPSYFRDLWWGLKKFEVRKNDRDFKIDDIIILREYEMKDDSYSGRAIRIKITYIAKMPWPIDNFIGFQFKRLKKYNNYRSDYDG